MTFLVDQSNLEGKSVTDLFPLISFCPEFTPLLDTRPERYRSVQEYYSDSVIKYYKNAQDCTVVKATMTMIEQAIKKVSFSMTVDMPHSMILWGGVDIPTSL